MGKTIYEMWKMCGEEYAELPAVRWLIKHEVQERTYGELAEKVKGIRKGLASFDFSKKHIALIGTSSVEWIETYMAVMTSGNAAVPLDPALPANDLADMIVRSDTEGVFIDRKLAKLADIIKAECPKVIKIWLI